MDVSEQLVNLNRSVALARVGGDEELLRELAELFLEEYPQLISAIQQAIEAGDAQTLERSAHTLKGSAASFGAARAVEAARRLEMIGKSGDIAAANSGLADLQAVMANLRPALVEMAAKPA